MLTLITVAMAFVLSHSFLASQAPTTAIVQNICNHSRARAIAETGLELAIVEVKRNASWRTDFTEGGTLGRRERRGTARRPALGRQRRI